MGDPAASHGRVGERSRPALAERAGELPGLRLTAFATCGFEERAVDLLLGGGLPSVAVRTGVSVRTVQRRLAFRGLTAQEVLRAERCRRLVQLLSVGWPLSVLPRMVGLGSSRALARFIRSAFDMTPRELEERVAGR